MVRFLHTADWQLGMTRYYLEGEAEARFRQARIDAVESLAALATERACDFVVVAGDVFDTNQVDRRTVRRTLEKLAAFDVPVLLLPANHDPLDAGSVFTSPTFTSHCPESVQVLYDTTPVSVADGIEVVGAPWTSKRPLSDLANDAIRDLEPAEHVIRVLVAHGGVDVLAPEPTDPALIRLASLESALADHKVHFVALGDRHSTTSLGKSGRVWHAGTPEPTAFDEVDPGNALVVDVDTEHCEVESIRVAQWRFIELARRVYGATDVSALDEELRALPDKDRTAVRLKLTGTLTLVEKEQLERSLKDLAQTLAALDRPAKHEDVQIRPDDNDFSDLPLSGYAVATRDRLQQMAAAGDDGTPLEALGLLLRLSRDAERGDSR